REEQLGGAAVSATAFEGINAHLSRYSYLVSLMPARIIAELGLEFELAGRRYSSYTPVPENPARGLLIDREDSEASRASFGSIGAEADFEAMESLYEDTSRLARALFPTFCE